MIKNTVTSVTETMDGFAKLVADAVQDRLGKDVHVEVQHIPKNNGVSRIGLIIHNDTKADSTNLSPIIYLDQPFSKYQNGAPLDAIVSEILTLCHTHTSEVFAGYEQLVDFDKVKDQICLRLISQERNAKLLETIPHVPFLNLAAIFYIKLADIYGRVASVTISEQFLELWEADADKLYSLALNNTVRLFPPTFQSMSSLLTGLDGLIFSEEELPLGEPCPDDTMFILSNSAKFYGATTLLYPGVLKAISENFDADLYILPSSIHETIIMPINQKIVPKAAEIKKVVCCVNQEQILPEEYLADSVYRYVKSKDYLEEVS